MKKIFLVSLFLIFVLQSCHYLPFTNYYFASKKTHFPKFSKWDLYKGTSDTSVRSCYDVTHYDWDIETDSKKKRINGNMKITFRVLEAQDSLMLDMQKRLKITDIKCNYPIKKWVKKKDALFIIFEKDLGTDSLGKIEIAYEGKPAKVSNKGPIFWEKDKSGNEWTSSVTQGTGPHFIMPCKDLLYDEPDSCNIHVKVSKDLMGIANGKLDSVSEEGAHKTFHWSVKNPINVYNLSFSIGNYEKLEMPYQDIKGEQQVIEAYALSSNKAKAKRYYAQAPEIMKILENLYGVFPWWKDGCKFVESPYIAMEHQSAIALGNNYQNTWKKLDLVLVHALTQEWWGNNVTAYDYADIWIHTGFANYTEALVVEKVYGVEDYNKFIKSFTHRSINKRPALKPRNVRYNSWVHKADQDIYPKGAALLHSIRKQMTNDKLFFKALKKSQAKFSRKNIKTEEFVEFFNTCTEKDFTAYFDLYLKEQNPPVLEFWEEVKEKRVKNFNYRWAKEVPADFEMKVKLQGIDSLVTLFPTNQFQYFECSPAAKIVFSYPDFGCIETKRVKKSKDNYDPEPLKELTTENK